MSKKLQGNGLFESSRMMLPEHKEAYIVHQNQLSRKTRPVLDEQEIERFSYMIAQSMSEQQSIAVQLYDPLDNHQIEGVVIGINQQYRQIKLKQSEELFWIELNDIVNITTL